MKRFKFRGNYHKLIDGFEVNESSREVKYSNVKIDFTGKGIQDLPLKYEECQLVDADVEEKQASEGETIEGTSFSIDYDSDRNFEYNLKGQTSQTGTPTPSSPQPINITTGRQVVSVCGKNIFRPYGEEKTITSANVQFTRNANGTITLNGTSNGVGFVEILYAFQNGTTQQSTPTLPLDISTQYKLTFVNLSGTTTSIDTRFVYQYNSTGSQATIYPGNSQTISNCDGLYRAYIRIPRGVTFNNYVVGIQIAVGNDTTYEEYKDNDYEINLGKNLFNKDNITSITNGTLSNDIITSNAISSNYGGVSANISGLTLEAGTYILSMKVQKESGTVANNLNTFLITSTPSITKTLVSNPNLTSDYQTYSVKLVCSGTTQLTNVGVQLKSGNTNAILKIKEIQLEVGSNETSFTPYKPPIYLGKIGTYQDYIKKSSGKNLLENTITTQTINGITFTHNDDGSITINGTASGGGAYIDFYNKDDELLVKDTTKTYTFSIGATNSNIELIIGERNVGSEIIDVIADGYVSSLTYTPTGRYTGQIFRLGVRNTATINNLTIYPQIEEGELSDYEPYGIGQWYIHKEIGKVVYDGSNDEAWSYLNDYDDNYLYQSLGINVDIENYSTNYLCSHALPNSTSSSSGNIGSYVFNKAFRLRVPSSIATTSGAFKTWLSSHNIEVYYVLNTPTNTLIEDEELINQLNSIELLEGLNNVSVSSANLPFIMNLHYNFNEDLEIVDEKEIIYTGYVNNYTLPKMKNKLEYRELDIDLLSPLALATLRTADAIGTYNLQPLIREIIQPLIDDGFKLKELNIGNNEISVNYLTETIESALNKLSNKFNFWWYIDKNKNIYINDINYIFNKNKVLTYDNDNSINGLIDFTPSMESIDYCNTIDFTNVRLITKSHFQKDINIIDDITNVDYLYYNPLISKDYINPGEEIEFDIPFIIDTNRRGYSSTGPNVEQGYFRLYENVNDALSELVSLRYDENNKVIIPNNASIGDSYNEDKEFVFVRDSFFKNLIVGMKYNGSTQIDVGLIVSDTALMWSKIRINNNEEIERNQDIISTSGIIEKQIDMNEQWLTFEELLEISNSLIGNNNVNVEKVNLVMDIENNLNVGDIISINKSSFLTYGEFIITDKKRSYYDNVDTWTYTLNNTNILESYVDLFRSREEEEQNEKVFNLISSDYSKEGFVEKYDVGVES